LVLAAIAAFGLADRLVHGLVAEVDHGTMERETAAAGVAAIEKFGYETRSTLAACNADKPAGLTAHEVSTVQGDDREKTPLP
jgi:hypothetical protein